MNYIKIKQQKLIISESNELKIYKQKFNDYINKLLINDLTTIDGRINAIRNKYNIHKLTPIYINKNICLLPINSINSDINIYINVFEVTQVISLNKGSEIVFSNQERIKINKSYNSLINRIKKACNIRIE